MGVLQFPVSIPVTVGTLPSLKFMVTTDNFATITTAGYLNSSNIDSANPMAPTDVVMVLYNYDPRFQTGTFEIFTVSITVQGVISLIIWRGGVVLPVEVNDIAMFYNTDGAIYDGVGITAMHQGDIQAGLSGTQGGFISYPGTPATGSLSFEASASSGNFASVLTNAPLTQPTDFFIPNPATSTADIAVAPAPLVNNNLIAASGTAGLIKDSGIPISSIPTIITPVVVGDVASFATTGGEIEDSGIAAANIMQKNIVNILGATGSIVANKVNGTEVSGLVTANGIAGVITTSTLTTAPGGAYIITWTNSFVTTSSVVLVNLMTSASTYFDIILGVIPGSGTVRFSITNYSSGSLDGIFTFSYLVM
jgi:hypothetical protein